MAINSPDAIDIRDVMVWSTWHRNIHHVAAPTSPSCVTLCGKSIKKSKAFVKTQLRNVTCDECVRLSTPPSWDTSKHHDVALG